MSTTSAEVQLIEDNCKLGDKPKESNQQAETPALPIIPDDDIDDSDDNFPLITSVFSLASSDESSSPEKKSKENNKEVTSPVPTSPSKGSPCSSPGNNDKALRTSIRVSPRTIASKDNTPYYVGKGKLILPKTEEGKIPITTQASGMTFSKMVSIQPIGTSVVTSSVNSGNKVSVGMMTRSTLKNAAARNNSSQSTGCNSPANVTSGSNGPMINLSTSVPFLNVQPTTPQISSTPSNTNQSNAPTSVNATSPLMQMVKRITAVQTTTAVTPNQGVVITHAQKGSITTPILTPTAPVTSPVLSQKPPVNTPVVNIKVPIAGSVMAQQQKPRHVNIAPAPSNTAHFVMVPKTIPTPTTTNQVVMTNPVGANVPRLVLMPKKNKTAPVTPGQLMYLIENKTADGKTYRFLIPKDSAKIVTTPKTTTVISPAAPIAVAPTPAVSATTPAAVATSPTQLIRIIPKPVQTTAVTQVPSISITSHSIPTATVSSPAMNVVPEKVVPTKPISNTESSTTVSAVNIAPSGSTSPTVETVNMTPTVAEEEVINSPPISPAPIEEKQINEDVLDTGLSPHEARIQKLKELLRKQEDAVDRLRQKRKQEIDDVRATPTATTPEANGPFAVPLPPKKARFEQNKRNKIKETNTQTSKDGFLPNTDDTQFVKLVGLEKVVDKLKARKLSESKVSE